jgi:hypothetical protein
LLGHDLVFTPQQPLTLDSIGVGTASPRAVPVNTLIALADRVVGGAAAGRLALVLPLFGAVAGVVALLRPSTVSGAVAAAGLTVWNPYVAERVAIGQWPLLWCYAAIPWIVVALTRSRGWRARAGTTAAVAAASIAPTGGIVAAVVVIAVCCLPRRVPPARVDRLWALGSTAVLQLPWIVPALLSPAAATSDPDGVAAFASRAEHAGGAVLTLLGGGGIWNGDVVPDSRTSWLPWVGLAVVVAAAVYGARTLVELITPPVAACLATTAVAMLVLAGLASVPGGDALLRGVVGHVPGGGLLRDGQKFVLVLIIVQALLAGAAAERLAIAFGRRSEFATPRLRSGLCVVVVAVVPVLLLPDAAAAVRPTIRPVHYPADWSVVARLVDGRGSVAVVPFSAYRSFPWTRNRPVLDPAPSWFRTSVVVTDDLSVSGRLLQGEDARSRRVGVALARPSGLGPALAAEGIRWVLVERDTPGPVPNLSELAVTYGGRSLTLYRVAGPIVDSPYPTARVALVLIADGLAGAILLAALVLLAGIVARSAWASLPAYRQ